jgi:hypothetical protein
MVLPPNDPQSQVKGVIYTFAFCDQLGACE